MKRAGAAMRPPKMMRSAGRHEDQVSDHDPMTGFRVARTQR